MSGTIERKLDKVLTTLKNLTERTDKLNFKLKAFDNHLNKLKVYLTIKLIN